ncbi:hypothetical protein BH11CYA1_BH11CYA1_01270 [soil metagenome]
MVFDDKITKAELPKAASSEGLANLQCEAWRMSSASDSTINAAARLISDTPVDGPYKHSVDKQFGGKIGYIRQASEGLRTQYDLPPDASSEQLYRKMAADVVATFPTASRSDKVHGLKSLQLDDLSIKDEKQVFKALIDRDRRQGGLPPLSMRELEANKCSAMNESELGSHLKGYKDAVKKGIPIDYN